ncbi:hypothetical protein [Streptomyces sp. NPDC058084]|uniref:hypothetical protein n=1 Tax=Streptomyces sp. NPDC058084 TaxID=3346333 RepID=UPI0036E5BD89
MDSMAVRHLADLGDTPKDHYTDAPIEVIAARAPRACACRGRGGPGGAGGRPDGSAGGFGGQGPGVPRRKRGRPADDGARDAKEACEEGLCEDSYGEEDACQEDSGEEDGLIVAEPEGHSDSPCPKPLQKPQGPHPRPSVNMVEP